jgi:hypothetical protein
MVGTRQQAHIIGTLEAVEAGGFRRRRRAAGCPGAWGICPGRCTDRRKRNRSRRGAEWSDGRHRRPPEPKRAVG